MASHIVSKSDRIVRMWLISDMRSRVDGQGYDGCGFCVQLKGCKRVATGLDVLANDCKHGNPAERDVGLYTAYEGRQTVSRYVLPY